MGVPAEVQAWMSAEGEKRGRMLVPERAEEVIIAAQIFGEFAAEFGSAHAAWKHGNPDEYEVTEAWPKGPRPRFDEIVSPAMRRMNEAKDALCLAARRLYDGAETEFEPGMKA